MTKTDTDEIVVDIKFMRVKTAGSSEEVRSRITGEVEIKIFYAYKACFSEEKRKGRLFRKLKYASDGVTIVGTEQVIEICMRNIFFFNMQMFIIENWQKRNCKLWKRDSF